MKKVLLMLFIASFLLACNGNKDKVAEGNYVEDLKAQVKGYPDSIQLQLILVDALDSLGRYKEALSEIDQLIAKDSLNYGLWVTKGKVQQNLTDTAAAIVSFRRAARVYPSPEALLALANLYAETKDAKVFEVCAMIDQLKLGREMDSYTHFFTGVYYSRIGDKQKAIEYFDRAINYNYTLMDTYIEKGSLYYEERNYAEAMKIFKTATTINNTFADGYYWQAKCYEAMNDKPNAMSSYSKAFALDKKMKEAEEGMNRMK
jgi:tetratricopeptide (TPR) repeat protein